MLKASFISENIKWSLQAMDFAQQFKVAPDREVWLLTTQFFIKNHQYDEAHTSYQNMMRLGFDGDEEIEVVLREHKYSKVNVPDLSKMPRPFG